jgi:glucose 1-dehydrogenase
MRLAGKVAVVTGGGAGIGRGIAERFLREGARVAIWELSADRCRRATEELGAPGAFLALAVDVGKDDQVQRAFEETLAAFGRVDILVNNAGISRPAPFLELTLENWDAVLETNLRAAFLCTQRLARHLVERGRPGRIINITSVDAELAYPSWVHYCAAKAGLKHFTASVALALAPHQITVNDIAPGLVLTEMSRHYYETPRGQSSLPAKVPMGRIGQPADIAALAAFLASDEAQYITGTTIPVDGAHRLGAHAYIFEQFRAR